MADGAAATAILNSRSSILASILLEWVFGGTDSSLGVWIESHRAPAALSDAE